MTHLECPCCGGVAAEPTCGNQTYRDGQPLICGCPGHVAIDDGPFFEAYVWINDAVPCERCVGGKASPPQPVIVSSDDRRTPHALYAALDARYGFVWDVAANAENATHGRFYFGSGSSFGEDALTIPSWQATIAEVTQGYLGRRLPVAFLNPPFSRAAGGIDTWLAKCEEEVDQGLGIVALLSADTSTKYFRRIQRAGWPVTFTKRLAYENQASGKREPAKFGSVIVEMWPPLRGFV